MAAALAAALLVAAAVAAWTLRPLLQPEVRRVARFAHVLPDDQVFTRPGRPVIAISPDGSTIVYAADRRLYARSLDDIDTRPIPGSEGDPAGPFFSPDGRWIGFYNFSANRLEKIAVSGGTPVPLAAATNPFGASWGADNTIVFAQATGIMHVSGDGGTPALLVPATGEEEAFHGPQALPDGRSLLFSTAVRSGGPDRWDLGEVVVQSLVSGERTVIVNGGSDAQYVPTGHVVYAVGNGLFAVPFDPTRLEVRGGPVPVVQGVHRAIEPGANTASANYGVSADGTLVYVAAASAPTLSGVPVWVSRDGREETPLVTSVLEQPRNPRLSPDGRRLAIVVDSQAWVYDATGRPPIRLTREGVYYSPVWSPDGRRLVLESDSGLVALDADASGVPEPLTFDGHLHPYGWSADGGALIAGRIGTPGTPETRDDLVRLTLGDPRGVEPIVATPAREGNAGAALSPDGRWLAYASDQTGQQEIWVRPYQTPGAAVRVSPNVGIEPVWARNGRELYYLEGTRVMAVGVEIAGDDFNFTPAAPLFTSPYALSSQPPSYDVAPDGRFLMIRTMEDDATPVQRRILIVQNWLDELTRIVPR